MKKLSAALAAHLESGATTLCWCWRLTRNDGARLGFTDHDRDIAFDGTTFEAAAGFSASDIRDAVGLSVDNMEVESALSSGRLEEDDLAAGLYDAAGVEIYRVNWQAPDQRVLIRAGSLGEVRRAGQAFTAEVRGLAEQLQQPSGRLFQYTCDADLGDSRCGVDLTAYRLVGAILAARSGRELIVSGLGSYLTGWFSRGLVTFTAGANAGHAFEVKQYTASSDGTLTIELWQEPRHRPQVGDAFTVTAGCDKRFDTCRSKFSNGPNFRGFPHMPGNDFVTAVARAGEGVS